MADLRARLGRIYRPDEHDWTLDQLHAHLQANPPALPEPLLTDTLGQSIDTSPWFATWANFRAFWRWIKAHRHPSPQPQPAPANPDFPVMWRDPIVLDQGDFGTCVGNGWAGWGDADPVDDHYDERDARAIYFEATKFDGTPDDPDAPGGGQQGSTVRSGAKAMQARKRLTAYAFAKSVDDIDHWLAQHGPVVMGTDWTNDMFKPDAGGFVAPSGTVAGGHCWVLIGRTSADDYEAVNSWNVTWGDKGHFRLTRESLGQLLTGIANPGEACLAAEVP